MNRLFVGQRVRIVCSSSPRNGCEAVITHSAAHTLHIEFGLGYFYWCDVAGWGRYDPSDGCLFAYPAELLEPIIPDGHRAAEESLEELLPFLKEQKVTA